MIIREFSTTDQLGVTKLQDEFMQEFFPEFYNDPRQYQWNADIYDISNYYLKNGGNFWVIEDNGEISGVGGFLLVNPTLAEIKRVRLTDSCRGKGFGKAIIHKIEDYCLEHNITKIFVDTDERLSIASAMYEKLGYKVYKTENIVDGNIVYVNYYFEKDLL